MSANLGHRIMLQARRSTGLAVLATVALNLGVAPPRSVAQTADDWAEVSLGASAPAARADHTLVVVGGQTYLFGGRNAQFQALGDLYQFDSSQQRFVAVSPSGPRPPARFGHEAVAFGGRMYVFFGLADGQYKTDVWAYDPVTNMWEQQPSTGSPKPVGRAFFGAAALDSRIVIAGGLHDGADKREVWLYDPATGGWEKLAVPSRAPGHGGIIPVFDYGMEMNLFYCYVCAFMGFPFAALCSEANFPFASANSMATGDVPPGSVFSATAPTAENQGVLVGGEGDGNAPTTTARLITANSNGSRGEASLELNFTTIPAYPIPISAAAAVPVTLTLPGRGPAPQSGVMVFGGTTSGGQLTNRAFFLRIDPPLPPTGPDLTATWVSLTQKCKNQKCKLIGSIDINNVGTEPAGTSTVSFYLSDDATYGEGDVLLNSLPVAELPPGQSTTLTLKKTTKLKLPAGVNGSGKYCIAVVDAGGAIDELDEANNSVVFGPLP